MQGTGKAKSGNNTIIRSWASFLPTFFYGNAVDRTPISQEEAKRSAYQKLMHLYSITSLVSASTSGGTVRPSALAVLRLMINSTLEVAS